MNTIIFWGAGKIGRDMLELWKRFGVQPDFFADNSPELQGTSYCGIQVLSPDELAAMKNVQILITCRQTESVFKLLLKQGICQSNIFKGDTLNEMLDFLTFHMTGRLKPDGLPDQKHLQENRAFGVLFDVQYGFVLGGVESWARQTAEEMRARNMEVKFITTDIKGWNAPQNDDSLIHLKYGNEESEIGKWMKCLTEIRNHLPCNLICNFTDYTFRCACMAKALWSRDVNLITVVHNDEETYYKRYGEARELIDACLVVSSKIRRILIAEGFPEGKICYLPWKIPCREQPERGYSGNGQPLRIGYAGRIVVHQKRADLLMEIAGKLNRLGVDFILEIVGTGDYRHVLDDQIKRENLTEKVKLSKGIEREKIPDFWMRQDVAVSCSDYEGRSISLAEAMAAGSVPVITDTSGAEDYVKNEYNGYIVPVGSGEDIVEKITYLYHRRELLKVMGERSHQVILRQNAESDLTALWRRILK